MTQPQYRVLRCPRCGNVAFSFTAEGWRKCDGPRSCGHIWDSGPAGREVVGQREDQPGMRRYGSQRVIIRSA